MNESEWILSVVSAFYEKAKIDILIGYHFRVIKDFDEHIPRIVSFWELQLLGSTQKEVNPPFDLLRIHAPLHIKRGEVGRWLILFKKTLDERALEHPEFIEMKHLWLERLTIFEGAFLRFFRL